MNTPLADRQPVCPHCGEPIDLRTSVLEDPQLRGAAAVIATGLVVCAVFRYAVGATSTVPAFLAGAAIAAVTLALEKVVKSSGVALAPDDAVINRVDSRVTAALRRYEVVFIVIAIIVVLTHLAGGGFHGRTVAPQPPNIGQPSGSSAP